MPASDTDSSHTDIRQESFFSRLPPALRGTALLLRLDRPVGFWLLFFPGFYGIWLAPDGTPARRTLYSLLFFLGAFLMRSAGCAANDLWDHKYDAQVERTRGRPLPAGLISRRQAYGILGTLILAGLPVLLCLPAFCWKLGVPALILALLYPAAKRFFDYPQLVMGITMGFPALVGYGAMAETLGEPAFLLYGAVIAWQTGFDTVYGFQDMKDDLLAGVKSASLRMRNKASLFLTACYGTAFFLLLLCGIQTNLSAVYYGLIAAAGLWLLKEARAVQPENPAFCLKQFRRNTPVGFLIAGAFLLGRLL